MNYMFNTTAAITSSIIACRLFVSLSRYLKHDAYFPSARPHLATRTRPAGGSGGNVSQVRAGGTDGDSSLAMIANSAFRIMGEGVDSMGQVYMDDLDVTTTASGHAVLDLKPEHDFGGGVDNRGEVIHVVDGRERCVKETDLENLEPPSGGCSQKMSRV